MGYGGYINFINGTTSTWRRSYLHHYQMSEWDFPEEIRPLTSRRVYIEWGSEFFRVTSDDAGEVTYTLLGSNKKFQIRARVLGPQRRMLQVLLEDLNTRGNKSGSLSQLGWTHDGTVDFILVELPDGSYICSTSNTAACWMQYSLGFLGDKKLNEICIAGSHDSGMSKFSSPTFFAHRCNTVTQSANVYDQLILGARYFDIRPVISGGKYLTGHYSQIPGGSWQGSSGQSIDSIVRNINRFTASHKELVILKLPSSLNTDVGNASYRPFNENELNTLFKKLENIQHLYRRSDRSFDLTTLKLNSFIGTTSSVFIVVGDEFDLGGRLGNGFYGKRNFNVYDVYSKTNDLDTMVNDQLEKMDSHSRSHYFLLSWTLTQSGFQAFSCDSRNSIIKYAQAANESLAYRLYPKIKTNSYPNIIYIDDIRDDRAAMIAMAVNQKLIHL